MFRKILIAFVLLICLAGFSYVKTYREHAKQNELYEKAKQEIAEKTKTETSTFVSSIDSLDNLLATKEESFKDSISNQSAEYQAQLDSLENIIDNQSAKITKLSQRPVQKTQAATTTKKQPTQLSQHEKVYRYYKQRYTDLPKDLSEYERTIALSEIREETASKFSISLTELSKIRKEYKLNY